jgi:hypothetical protein
MQDGRGEAVLAYCEPRTTPQMGRNRRAEGQHGQKSIKMCIIPHHAASQHIAIVLSMLMNNPSYPFAPIPRKKSAPPGHHPKNALFSRFQPVFSKKHAKTRPKRPF